MDKFQPPPTLDLTGNIAENWKKFIQRFRLYLEAIEKSTASHTTKTAILLTVAGSEALDVYNTFTFATTDHVSEQDTTIKFESVITKFQEHCSPQQNETYQRYIFRSTIKQSLQPIDKFITDIKNKAKSCNFEALESSLVRDQIVIGVRDIKLKERLLREPNLDLPKTEKLCYAAEAVQRQMKNITVGEKNNGSGGVRVDDIHQSKSRFAARNQAHASSSARGGKFGKSYQHDYRNCGTKHQPRKCPAYGMKCSKCGKFNHYSSCCYSNQNSKKVDVVTQDIQHGDSSTDSGDDFYISCIVEPTVHTDNRDDLSHVNDTCVNWIIKVSANNCLLSLKVDTGAQINVISSNDMQQLSPRPQILKRKINLKSYQGQTIPCKGLCILNIDSAKGHIPSLFAIVPQSFQSVLGLSTAMKLGILDIPKGDKFVKHELQVNSIETKPPKIMKDFENSSVFGDNISQDISTLYGQIFEGMGTFGEPYTIVIKPDYSPVINPVRKVPFSKKHKMREELDRMESLGVISKIDTPTEFVHSLVLTPKSNGELRCCLDPRTLNKSVRREHFHIKTREEILSEVAGAQYFSQLDLKSAYWQIQLDPDSRHWTAFGTPFGRYVYNVVPFGMNSASEICQKRIEKHLIRDVQAMAHQDNILVWGKTVQEHDLRLKGILDNVLESGAKLRLDKCEFRVQETQFLGETLTPQGIQPNPKKVRDVLNIATPECREQLQAILGLINFFSKFIPNLSGKTQCMRTLLQKNSTWSWDNNHEQELETIKAILTSSPVLVHFDPSKNHKISSDASQGGLGSVLLQYEVDGWHSIAYASRSITKHEREYAQVEKEALAVTWAIDRFHSYLYGHHFEVETDNRPLSTIFSRGLSSAPFRIQGFMLKLQLYTFDVVLVPRKYIKAADYLSKVYVANSDEKTIDVS